MDTDRPKFLRVNHKSGSKNRIHLSEQSLVIETLKCRLNELQVKFDQFITNFNTTQSENSLQSHSESMAFDKHHNEIKKQIINALSLNEAKNFSGIFNKLLQIEKIIPKEFESLYIDMKTEVFMFILHLKKPKELKRKFSLPEFNIKTLNPNQQASVKFSARETYRKQELYQPRAPVPIQTTSLSNDLSKSNEGTASPTLSNPHLTPNRKKVPQLLLQNLVHDFPINSAKLTLNKSKAQFSTYRDRSNTATPSLEAETFKFSLLLKTTKKEIYRCREERDFEKMQKIYQIFNKFTQTVKAIEKTEGRSLNSEEKLRKELENCKKVASMYEEKIKIKNQTIAELRKKGIADKENISLLIREINGFVVIQKNRIDEISKAAFGKLEAIDAKILRVQEAIRRRLSLGLEEIRKIVAITEKNQYFDEEIEMYKKKFEESESVVKGLYGKIKNLELENVSYKQKASEIEKYLHQAKKEASDSKNDSSQLHTFAEQNEKLRKSEKIKEFELKQLKFENSELISDKTELLNKIESLEIEIIEAQEAFNNSNLKYGQEIEEFLYTNTMQAKIIASLESEIKELSTSVILLKEAHLKESCGIIEERNELFEEVKKLKEIIESFNGMQRRLEESEHATIDQQNLEKSSEPIDNHLEQELLKQIAIFEQRIQDQEVIISSIESNYVPVMEHQKLLKIVEDYERLVSENKVLSKQLKESSDIIIEQQNNMHALQVLADESTSNKINQSAIDLKLKNLLEEHALILKENDLLKNKLKETEIKIQESQNEADVVKSANSLLIEDIKTRNSKYRESLEDLELDTYTLQKDMVHYKDLVDSSSRALESLSSKLIKLKSINNSLKLNLATVLEENQITTSTKNILLSKISELEEDIKNLTSKLLKKNNENSILEDQLMVYSPRGTRSIATSENDLREENVKLKCELIELHKGYDEVRGQMYTYQSQLYTANNYLNEFKEKNDSLSIEVKKIQAVVELKSSEVERLEKYCEDLKADIGKLEKFKGDLLNKRKNDEVTYKKNVNYLEEQLKKYKRSNNESPDLGLSFISSPRSFDGKN